jgi:hypothetical protein
MTGEVLSEEDQKAYIRIQGIMRKEAQEKLPENFKKWFATVNEQAQTLIPSVCCFCESPIKVSMLNFSIASAKCSEPAFNCESCADYMSNVKYCEERLSENGGTYMYGRVLS